MERLYRDFDIITNPVHTSNQQRLIFIVSENETVPSFYYGSVKLRTYQKMLKRRARS